MNKWDKYFHSHYNPRKKKWGEEDLNHYRNWYFAWINYIDAKLLLEKRLSNVPKVLEVGSAIGAVSAMFADKGWYVTGSDISREMVRVAAKLSKNVKFIYCDIQKKIPGLYDAIFAFEVLEHIQKPEKAIQNIKKGLKKGGIFIGSSPYPFPKNFTDPTHCSVKYPREWKEIFKKEKFSEITTYPMSFFPFLWRINKRLNVVLPFYISFPGFVSTTLIIAKR